MSTVKADNNISKQIIGDPGFNRMLDFAAEECRADAGAAVAAGALVVNALT